MKNFFMAALLFVGIASFAQDAESDDMDQKPMREQRERMTPEQRNERQLKKLTSDLALDAKQQEQVKQLIAERSAKAEKLREARKEQREKGTKLTAEQREALKKEMTAEADANDAKMKGILTADQYTKWKKIQEENKDKARDRMREYRRNN
ncbi:hypothetical protein [Flavobacterium sp. RS13.1]|jgi:hypothetical protein|uniref:hypothetical protein n=1 Tax=Flavobacterium sp. RS13.1 TaxID=3400345 RepID=UPI003AAA8CBD